MVRLGHSIMHLFGFKKHKLRVMCQTPLYRTSNVLEHQFLNIEGTRMCSSFGNQAWTLYFWLRTNRHRTLSVVRPITISWYLLSFVNQGLLVTHRWMPTIKLGKDGAFLSLHNRSGNRALPGILCFSLTTSSEHMTC